MVVMGVVINKSFSSLTCRVMHIKWYAFVPNGFLVVCLIRLVYGRWFPSRIFVLLLLHPVVLIAQFVHCVLVVQWNPLFVYQSVVVSPWLWVGLKQTMLFVGVTHTESLVHLTGSDSSALSLRASHITQSGKACL